MTGVQGTLTPAMAATWTVQMPAALTTISQAMSPFSVTTPAMAPLLSSRMAVTRVWVRISAPNSRAARATA